MMRLDLAVDDFIGARSQQQDAAAARGFGSEGGAVLILADGLGGHTGGAEASRIVVETFREAADAGAFDDPARRHGALREALELANARIANGVDPAHGQRGMASTAVASIVANGRLSWVSVGDSHLYLWRQGRMTKLNADHSQAGLMVQSGQYQPDDPEVLAVKSVLVSALTGRRLEIVDHPTQSVEVVPGDIILLASDGLNTLSEPEIERLLTSAGQYEAREIGATLLDTVRDRRADRQDNTAVVVARIVGLATVASVQGLDEAGPPTQGTAPTEIARAEKPGSVSAALGPDHDDMPVTQRSTESALPSAAPPPVAAAPAPQARPQPAAAAGPAGAPPAAARPPDGRPAAAKPEAKPQQAPAAARAAKPDGKAAAAAPGKAAAVPIQLPALEAAGGIPATKPTRPSQRARSTGGPPVGLLATAVLALALAAAAFYFYQSLNSTPSDPATGEPGGPSAAPASSVPGGVVPAPSRATNPRAGAPAPQPAATGNEPTTLQPGTPVAPIRQPQQPPAADRAQPTITPGASPPPAGRQPADGATGSPPPQPAPRPTPGAGQKGAQSPQTPASEDPVGALIEQQLPVPQSARPATGTTRSTGRPARDNQPQDSRRF